MNAAEQMNTLACVHALASVSTLVRGYFPEAFVNLNPWRDDPQTRRWSEQETIDLAFHFPGWSPRLQCRSLLMQLRVRNNKGETSPHLLGVLLRGMTFEGERWRLVTVGNWELTGSHLPQPAQISQLREICRGLFVLFPACSSSGEDA